MTEMGLVESLMVMGYELEYGQPTRREKEKQQHKFQSPTDTQFHNVEVSCHTNPILSNKAIQNLLYTLNYHTLDHSDDRCAHSLD